MAVGPSSLSHGLKAWASPSSLVCLRIVFISRRNELRRGDTDSRGLIPVMASSSEGEVPRPHGRNSKPSPAGKGASEALGRGVPCSFSLLPAVAQLSVPVPHGSICTPCPCPWGRCEVGREWGQEQVSGAERPGKQQIQGLAPVQGAPGRPRGGSLNSSHWGEGGGRGLTPEPAGATGLPVSSLSARSRKHKEME